MEIEIDAKNAKRSTVHVGNEREIILICDKYI